MNRVRLAQQGYERLTAEMARQLDEHTSDRAEAWLRDEVCPVVQQLIASQRFRLAARWSVDHLAPGARMPERHLVDAVDAAMVELAAAMANAASAQVDKSSIALPEPELRGTIELIASRPWFDLVLPEDYFHPEQHLLLRKPDHAHTDAFRSRGDLRIPLGDYVIRSLLARTDYWTKILERASYAFLAPKPGDDALENSAREGIFAARIELDEATRCLTDACRSSDEAKRRDACAALTQVYTAYSDAPALDWLGCRPGSARANRGLIRSCVRRHGEVIMASRDSRAALHEVGRRPASLCDPAVLRQIAGALVDVVPFYDLPDDPDELIAWALDRARLLLVDRFPREVYWEGTPVSHETWDFHSREWNLLWVLARQTGKPVDQEMLMMRDGQSIKSRRHRLAKMLKDVLPLDALIDTVRGHGYRLQLEATDVILLSDPGDGRLVFDGPGRTLAP